MKHEQSTADSFNSFMRLKAHHFNCSFHAFSVDGQDRDAGGDYVLTNSTQFAIIEFKHTYSDLLNEKKKKRRLMLCQQLKIREDMRLFHDRCHFISWTEDLKVKMNIYRFMSTEMSLFFKKNIQF